MQLWVLRKIYGDLDDDVNIGRNTLISHSSFMGYTLSNQIERRSFDFIKCWPVGAHLSVIIVLAWLGRSANEYRSQLSLTAA